MKNSVPGYIYVLELTDGIVKVGLSVIPAIRLKQHARGLLRNGVGISQEWISPRHAEAAANERLLKSACESLGGEHIRADEWFAGVSFDDVVATAEVLPFTPHEGTQTMTLEEARPQLGEIVDRARFTGEATLLTRKGKPAGVIVNADWYEAALSFIGEFRPILGGYEIRHKDGDPRNNDPGNLEIRESGR